MNAHTRDEAFGASLVLSAAVLWGTVGPAQVLASSDSITPAALGGWRLFAGGLLLAVLTVRPRRMRRSFSAQTIRPLIVCAFCAGAYQVAFLSAVARTGAALATVVALGMAPASTGLCAWLVRGESVRRTWLAGSVAAVAGCVLLLAPGGARVDPLGLSLAIAGGACYGPYTVFAKHFADTHPASELSAFSALCLLAGSAPLVPWIIGDATSAHGHELTALALIGWLSVATAAIAYSLFAAGLSRVRATTAGTLSLAEPLAAALIGVLLLHERLSPTAWTGCALILLGMMVTTVRLGSERRPAGRHR